MRISPEKLEIDDGLGRGAFDQLLKDGGPFLGSGNIVQTHEYFVSLDGIIPILRLTSGYLLAQSVNRSRHAVEIPTSWLTIQTIKSERVKVRP